MAIHMLSTATVTINGVDLTVYVASVTVSQNTSELNPTAMGATGIARLAGLGDDSFEIEFWADFAAAKVDATLSALVGAAVFPVVVRASSAAVSATNPKFTGSCLLTSYTPIAGAAGDVHKVTVSLPVSGRIVRAEA